MRSRTGLTSPLEELSYSQKKNDWNIGLNQIQQFGTQLAAVADADSIKNRFQMILNRVFTETELCGDLPVGMPIGGQNGNFLLPWARAFAPPS